MPTKLVAHGREARDALQKGIDVLSETVSITLGPRGRNVVLAGSFGVPQIINDGVTIARHLRFLGARGDVGVSLLRQAASRTNDVAGDGTTTSTVLAHSIISEGRKKALAGVPSTSLRVGINFAAAFASEEIKLEAEPLKKGARAQLSQVATVASGNDPSMGTLIASAFDYVGREGLVSVCEGKGQRDELEITRGMSFSRGFLSSHFVNDRRRMEVSLGESLVFLTDRKISSVPRDLVPVLEAAKESFRAPNLNSLLIVSDTMSRGALATLVLNRSRDSFGIVAVRAPGFAKHRALLLEDIAILTGGQVSSGGAGLSLGSGYVAGNSFGKADSVLVTQGSTSIVSMANEREVLNRCKALRRELRASSSTYDKSKIEERLRSLSGGAAVLRAGGVTTTEQKDRKLRLEDAVHATRAAFEEGVVPGGGSCLVRVAEKVSEWCRCLPPNEREGALCVVHAMRSPLKRIASNSGRNGESVFARVIHRRRYGVGYDASRNVIGDMRLSGVIDPARVVRVALQNAASVAGMILTTECMVTFCGPKDVSRSV